MFRPTKALAPAPFRRRALLAPVLLVPLALGACGGGSSDDSGSFVPPGTLVASGFAWPAGFQGSSAGFYVDPHHGGAASTLELVDSFWGRLVDLYDYDPVTKKRALQHRDLVVGEEVASDGSDYLLETNPATQAVQLVILHPAGSAAYTEAFARLDDGLGPIQPKGLSPSELPPFSFLARNAALVLRFDDLLDHDSIDEQTLRMSVGYPPVLPFQVRVLADPNHGGLVDGGAGPEFRSTRVIVDPTVSPLEALATSLPQNALGLPASTDTFQPNVVLRIPTQLSFSTGQFALLRSHGGEALVAATSAPFDAGSSTLDVVRAVRSGGDPELTGDPNNGFLYDIEPPRLIAAQPGAIGALTALGAGDYSLSFQFQAEVCAAAPRPGDTIVQPGVIASVVAPAAPPQGGTVSAVQVHVLSPSAGALASGPALYFRAFDASVSPAAYGCYFAFVPSALAPPTAAVPPTAQIVARFSEPLDPTSVKPFDTFTVTRSQPSPGVALPIDHYVVGEVTPSSGLDAFRFQPVLPLAHSGQGEDYYCALRAGAGGLRDLAGNPLLGGVAPTAKFTIDPTAPHEKNSGIALRFSSADEDLNGKPELRGQFLHDLGAGLIRPRPVTRFSAVADRQNAMLAIMPPIQLGLQTPLSPLGSKLMAIYRYCDLGFSSTDEQAYDIDVEHLNWSPRTGSVVADAFDGFRMGLTHADHLPDEFPIPSGPTALLPQYPDSGLEPVSYGANVLTDPHNQLAVVHEKAWGYLVDPSLMFVAPTGTPMMPWPLNGSADVASYRYYTWRDTAIRATGAPDGVGMDLAQMALVGLAAASGKVAKQGNVPSIGLPLLMEFRCYPGDGLGLNALDSSIASNSSPRPFFRLFSTGGLDTSQQPITKEPDLEDVPSGGFNANPLLGPMGMPTPPADNVVYIGQVDFVFRVSRVHTVWFDTLAASPDYAPPVLEPRPDQLPLGTSISLAYRGAVSIAAGSPAAADALALDAYGDEPAPGTGVVFGPPAFKNPSIVFPLDGAEPDDTWKDEIDALDGRRYFQARITFVNNTASGKSPELSAVGIAFETAP